MVTSATKLRKRTSTLKEQTKTFPIVIVINVESVTVVEIHQAEIVDQPAKPLKNNEKKKAKNWA